MPRSLSSRERFRRYKEKLRERLGRTKKEGLSPSSSSGAMPHHGMGALPGVGHKRQRSFGTLFREFWRLMRGHRAVMIGALCTVTLSVMISLVTPYGTKVVFDNVLDGRPLEGRISAWLPHDRHQLLTAIVLACGAMAVVSIPLNMWGRWQATRITKRLQVSVRRIAFDHAVRLPLHRVYELKSGGAASVLREDAGGVGELVFAMLYNPWRAIIQLVMCLTILGFTSWRLLLGSLLVIPAVWITHRTWINRIRPIFADIRQTRTSTDAHATETFGGMRVVRSFTRERSESGQFTRNQSLMARQEILAWWWSRAIDVAWSALIPVASGLLLWFGGRLVLDGGMTKGDLIMFLTYLVMLLGPLEALASSATQLQNSLAGLDRVLNLLAEPREMPDRPGARVIDPLAPAGRIEVRHVGYTYPKTEKPVLKDVSFTADPGEMIALVGPSGAGKTTLCNLIARFYDPLEGAVFYDGTDLRDIQLQTYRALLGIVEQDTFLFDGTIAENIAYGNRFAGRGEIEDAARKANAHTFISEMPEGYDTLIGERGVKLSGGQRQRLTIARALLADPRILILDEATSNLDTESERLIQQSLKSLMAGRTSFVIAHRLSTIAHAHRILVVEQGRIVESGRHAELLERSGRYRQMVELQTAPPAEPKIVAGRPVVAGA